MSSCPLTGPGGGTDGFDEAGGTVTAHNTAQALNFADWGTQRSSSRDSDVTVTNDSDLAARLLDAVNIIRSGHPRPAADR
ncbi:hypothetical protein ACN24M_39315 [Streptomyces microflavus]|uniref:hypothetical protein n=1 Tax=Streptomyces microflavus TaxID=1919 RepID=UPI003B226B6D